MVSEPLRHLNPRDYPAFERQAEIKHEYVGGEPVAMTGASLRHNVIVSHLVAELRLLAARRSAR